MTISGLKLGQDGTRHLNKRLPTTGTPSNLVQGVGTLSMATKPTADDTVTIGSVVYTFVETPADAGDVAIGATVANSQANLLAAINDGDAFNDAHPLVTAAAWDGDELVVTANEGGTAGNLDSEETFSDETDAWGASTLVNGAGTQDEDANVGTMYIDDTNFYICIVDNGKANQTWRKVPHSAL